MAPVKQRPPLEQGLSIVNILFFGDIVGKPGRHALASVIGGLRRRYGADAVIANGENAAGGFGLTAKVIQDLFNLGVDVITTGNHIWDKKEALQLLKGEERVIRPLNFAPECPGRGVVRLELAGGKVLRVANLQGKVMMPPIACPFRAIDQFLDEVPSGEKCLLVDFHAEATSEKRAMGFYLDGRASLVIGTHTHVQTNDAEILPKGTGYISDAGMTGSFASVIGMDVEDSTRRILTGMPVLLNVAKGNAKAAVVFAEVDDATGRCVAIERMVEPAAGN